MQDKQQSYIVSQRTIRKSGCRLDLYCVNACVGEGSVLNEIILAATLLAVRLTQQHCTRMQVRRLTSLQALHLLVNPCCEVFGCGAREKFPKGCGPCCLQVRGLLHVSICRRSGKACRAQCALCLQALLGKSGKVFLAPVLWQQQHYNTVS